MELSTFCEQEIRAARSSRAVAGHCQDPTELPTSPAQPPCSCRAEDKGTYVMVKRGSDVLLKQLPIPMMARQPLRVCCPQAATKPSHQAASHQTPRAPAWRLTQATISFLGDSKSAPVHAPGARQALGSSQPGVQQLLHKGRRSFPGEG